MRRRNTHLAEENVGELLVVMLAGVNEDGVDLRMALHFTHERRDFRKIGPGADDIRDFEALAHEVCVFGRQAQYSIGVLCFRRGLFAIRAKKVLVRCREVRFRGENPVK